MLIAVFGLPGSGKSYFASHLAQALSAKYVNSDKIRRQLFNERQYTADEKEKVYDVMIEEMKLAIQSKEHIVLDATFYRRNIRRKFNKASKSVKEKIVFIEVQAEEEVIRERLGKKRLYSEADYPVYQKVKKSFEPMKSDHLVLESTQNNLVQMLDKALKYLAKL